MCGTILAVFEMNGRGGEGTIDICGMLNGIKMSHHYPLQLMGYFWDIDELGRWA